MPTTPAGAKERFAKAITRLREAAGLSKERLAHLSGLNRSHILKIEQAGVDPSLTTIVKLASAFKLTAAQLLAEMDRRA